MPSERKINSAGDCISFMQAGCELKKIRSNTRIYSRFFTLDLDIQALRWEPSKKDPEKAKLDVSSLKEVRVGKNTETFRSCAVVDQICEDCSFSLIHGENYESLDLVASSADIANIWVTGLRYVTSHTKQALDLLEGKQNTLRTRWLHSVFEHADVDGNGIMLEDKAVKLIMQLNQGLNETKIRVNFREIQNHKGKLTTRVTKEEFTDVYCDLCTRPEVYFLLVQISGNKEYLDAKDLMFFLEAEQGILNATEEMCLDLIRRYEPSEQGRMNGNLGIDGFTRYLISPECNIFDPEHNKVCQDMTQPLSHYYINASHNTYLTEIASRSPSDLLGYIKALKLGCRSIELDVYDGPDEPVVSKRNNVTSTVSFRNVIKVINQYAFVTSEYPLIMCLRNHCSVGQQKDMAQKMKMIFGNKMFTGPPDSTTNYLPSPEMLKRKIILKGRKLPQNTNLSVGDVTDEDEEREISRRLTDAFFVTKRKINLCRELSDLVTLCQTVQFSSFQNSMKKQKYWEICNFSEPEASTLVNECPEDFVNYNKRFLSRVYSGHLGLESSNLNPQEFWNCGCQIVTINYQTPGPMLDLNIGWFRQNGCCGYVLKPAIMRDEVSYFNAYTKGIIVPGTLPQVLHIKIISGQMFPKPKDSGTKGDVIDPYVYVEIRGIPADCAEMRTKTVHQNGKNPIFDESFEFEINLPELVTVRFVALDDDYIGDEFIGQYTIPYECLQSGYRYIPLYSFTGEEIELAALFVHIATTDRRGGGKAHKRGYSVRKGKNTKYTRLRNTGIKVIDDTFKSAGQPLREAADIRENVQNAIVSFKEICGLAPTANLTQCMLTTSSRLLNHDNTSSVSLNIKDNYPYLEPFGMVSEVQKKVLSSYDLVIQETKYLIDVADTLYDKIMQCRESGLEFHEEIHNLAKKEGLKGSKKSKTLESFAWNITVLKGQGDLLKNAKNEALENMKNIQTACTSCGLTKSGSGSAEMKFK